MAWSIRQFRSRVTQPDVRLNGSRGLILFDDMAEHRLFNPSLGAMLRRYRDCPESRPAARKWIDEANHYASPFGFAAVCEYLDLDADYVRRGLVRWMNEVDNGAHIPTMSNNRPTTSNNTQPADQGFTSRMPNVSPLMLGSRSSAAMSSR
jgi:hypothetical protein